MKELYEYPLRTCYSMHSCCVCDLTIRLGEKYYDGGLNKRCHVECAPPVKMKENIDNKVNFSEK